MRSFVLLAGFIGLIGSLGCDATPAVSTAAVTGSVTLDGEPIAGGYVQFFPTDSTLPGATGIIQADGTYTLNSGEAGAGAAVGTHKVSVQPPEEQSFGQAEQTTIVIPQKYQESDSSQLVAEVTAEGLTFDIELTSE